MAFRKKTDEEQLNIRDKLNAEQAIHNRIDYWYFDLFARKDVPKPVIGRIMNVSKNTVYDWLQKREALLKSEEKQV